jgi:hypothetical protein
LPSSILPSITMQTCSIVNLLPAIGFFGIYTLTFVISLDRLISVYFALWLKFNHFQIKRFIFFCRYAMRKSSKYYFFTLAILTTSVLSYISILVLQNGRKYGNL